MAIFKPGIAAAEDKVHRALHRAVLKHQAHFPFPAQLFGEEALIPFDQIRRQRTQKQGILGRSQGTVFHEKFCTQHAQRDLLALHLRRSGIIDHG